MKSQVANRKSQMPLWASLLVAALSAIGCLAAAGADGGQAEALFAPGASGCVTSWLVAGPFGFLRDAQLDEDFLRAVGGEAAVRPRAGDAAEAAKRLAWQAAAFADPVLNFKDRCLPLGKSAFYLAAVLVARRDLELTLGLTHTGQARAWLDGKQVIRSDKDPFGLGPRNAEHAFALKAGQRAHLLLKLGSEGRYLQFIVRLRAGMAAAKADDLTIALPLKPGAKPAPEAFVLASLGVGTGRERFVEPGQKAVVTFGAEGSYPLCDGQVAAAITVQDSKGKAVAVLKTAPAKLADLAAAPAELAWTPPRAAGSPFYKLVAAVTYEGRELGTVSKTVYSPNDIGQWTADLHKRLLAAATASKLARDDFACVMLRIEKAILLQQGGDLRAGSLDDVYHELETASEWLTLIEAGKGLPPIGPGSHELAYLAEQDDSAQPYYLHVPTAARAPGAGDGSAKPLPAIVYLHGYAPWLDKTNWHEVSAGLLEQAEARGYLVIVPFARSNTDFQSIGEWDTLHVLRLAGKRFSIDPDRIFLVGYSMGGSGVYTLAAHYPDLWAGAVVLCGRPRNYLWKDLDPARVEPFKRHLLDLESGLPHIQNFLHLPFLVFQGTNDVLVQPEQAYSFVEAMKAGGMKAELVRLEGQSHWIGDETFSTPKVLDWMDAQRRVAAPREVRLKTYSLRYNRAWWLAIDVFERWGEPAEVSATLLPGNKLQLTARNIAALTLRPPNELADPKTPLTATINGAPQKLEAGPGGAFAVTIAPRQAGGPRKTPTLCGPIKDAFNHRFVLVYGTAGGKEPAERNRTLARKVQKEWYAFAKGFRNVVPDTSLTDAEIARSNLILFGTPKTNAVLARMAGKLPIRFSDDGYELLGKTYKATETTGIMFIYPNPLAPQRYIVVYDGAHYGEKLGENHKYDLLPDFIIYSDEPDYDDTNCYHVAGFFDCAWQLDPKLLWTSDGRPKPRPSAPAAPPPY